MSGGGRGAMPRKRLITERDVERLAAGGRLRVDRETLVTPAARDLAFARGIDLAPDAAAHDEAAPGRCGCSGCKGGGPCACAGPWPALADGDYLLEVRDGRVRARRIAP